MRDGINGHRKCTFRRRARALARDTRGATIIEFAIVAMPFIVLLIAILQTSLVFFAQQLLEPTAEDPSRVLLTNQAQKAGTSQADFQRPESKHGRAACGGKSGQGRVSPGGR